MKKAFIIICSILCFNIANAQDWAKFSRYENANAEVTTTPLTAGLRRIRTSSHRTISLAEAYLARLLLTCS